jgi:type II restriction/modification system DNA methylase subunit YeeA
MNKANLKSYAPKARLDFIKAVTERANVLGISAAGVLPAEVRGGVALIDGREWPAKVAGQRDELVARIKRQGFAQTMDEVAYTWFNRFAALRYMEIHDYLGHGWRVLSSRDGGLPEILRHASEVTLPGLNPNRARDMQLAGNQDNELYKLLLVAQCNDLSRVMPFLFERIDDETELLLPENLLRTDSIVAKLVEQVPEEDWQEIEVIGWLYQFYISEKKDQVIGKVVKSEDIPAATQLFTPNWIVQYLVQNSVGRLWLMANPTSTLASQWPYYIQPAVQTPEVRAQLNVLIQMRIREDGETLNPETITVLDPACGSGHILVVTYDVLKAIYLERGYQPRAIPRLILEKNLYGLDIDDRAAQLAAFALLMKARADDRRLFIDPPKLNVLSLQESKGLDADELATHLAPFGLQLSQLKALLDTFVYAKTIGSLIQISSALNDQLAGMTVGMQLALRGGDLYAQQAAKDVLPLVRQALTISMQFDAVVANPPYMGGKYLTPRLKTYLKLHFDGFEKDLFSVFIARSVALTKPAGYLGFMSPFVWMFISTYQRLRQHLIEDCTLSNLVQLEYSGFDGATVPICAFMLMRSHSQGFLASFIRLEDFRGADQQGPRTIEAIRNRKCGWFFDATPDSFNSLPGKPIAYWLRKRFIETVAVAKPLDAFADTRKGMITLDDSRFTRRWFEVAESSINLTAANSKEAVESGRKWFPITKGGGFRKWAGLDDTVVNWLDNGKEIKDHIIYKYNGGSYTKEVRSESFYFKPALSWGLITSAKPSFRTYPSGFIIGNAGPCMYLKGGADIILPLLNSRVGEYVLKVMCPTLNFAPGDISRFPVATIDDADSVCENANELVRIHQVDWNECELSWGFSRNPLISVSDKKSLAKAFEAHSSKVNSRIAKARELEEKNNESFIRAYCLEDELSAEVPQDQITLAQAEREKDSRRLISYAIGCMMGRYSLDEPGLIYAHTRKVGFDPSRYGRMFLADADGIVPLTDERWFEDDPASRVREFLHAAWDARTLEENMAWLAESLGTKGSETPDESIRRYLATKFFKDHLQTYKKRPIYWLFSSGKQGAFQALVYLHRYNEGTLARMRAEYVVPLIAKMVSRLDMLDKDLDAASLAAARTKLRKQIELLRKKQIELLAYDEKLRHYADMRITLDLDDGVKVNYAKFGDLVAESKTITGGSDD